MGGGRGKIHPVFLAVRKLISLESGGDAHSSFVPRSQLPRWWWDRPTQTPGGQWHWSVLDSWEIPSSRAENLSQGKKSTQNNQNFFLDWVKTDEPLLIRILPWSPCFSSWEKRPPNTSAQDGRLYKAAAEAKINRRKQYKYHPREHCESRQIFTLG